MIALRSIQLVRVVFVDITALVLRRIQIMHAMRAKSEIKRAREKCRERERVKRIKSTLQKET